MRPWPKSRLRNKFGAKRTNGFSSKLESAVFDFLTLLERSGEINNIEKQPQVHLTRASIGYKPDFKYFDIKRGTTVWVEAKGLEVGEWRIKKKLWRSYGPGPLLVYKGSYRRLTLDEEIIPSQKGSICPGCGAMIPEK